MGACCGSGKKIYINHKGATRQLKESTDMSTILSEVKSFYPELNDSNFYLTINGVKLASENQLAQALRKKSTLTLAVVVKEEVKISSTMSIYPLSQTTCSFSLDSNKFTALLLTPKYVLVPKIAISNNNDLEKVKIQLYDYKKTLSLKEGTYIDLKKIPFVILELNITRDIKSELKKRSFCALDISDQNYPGDKCIALFFSQQKPTLSEERIEILAVNKNVFSISKTLPFSSLGGGVCGTSGKLKGIIAGAESGKCLAISITSIIDALQAISQDESTVEYKLWKSVMKIYELTFPPPITPNEQIYVKKDSIEEIEADEIIFEVKREGIYNKQMKEGSEEQASNLEVEVNIPMHPAIQVEEEEEEEEPALQIPYKEITAYINPLTSQMITYHPNEYSVTYHDLKADLYNDFTIVPSEQGLYIISEDKAWLWETNKLTPLNELQVVHKKHAAAIYKNMLIVISGKNTSKVEGFNLISKTNWMFLEDLNKPRESAVALSMEDGLYLYGGIKHEKTCNSVLRYNFRWEKIGWKLPERLSQFGVLKADSGIIVFGGYTADGAENTMAWEVENGESREIGEPPVRGSFYGHHAGRFGALYVTSTINGRLLSFNAKNKKFYLLSIGNNEGFAI
ncbi:unnamed protein product [Blepharisma stoltei]|uniref:Uncharacterized protein n=1 Tax=Blepharisma stoltei TaxID=1481888 RepID=A0AAU9J0H8_9CILI|nr:unnamed protein product [Blepharisma stoltei]